MLVNINTSLKAPASFDGLNSVAQVPTVEFEYPKGTEIFGASEPAQYIYQVIEGAVRSYKLLSDGRRQIGAFHLAGDVFGLEFDDLHRFSAEAVIPTKLRLVKRQSLERSAQSNLATMLSLRRMASTNLRHAEDHLLLLGQKTGLERVAYFLVEMERRSAAAGVLSLPMNRRDIADYLGLTLETVSRALTALLKRGVIKFMVTQRDIVVTDTGGLAEIDLC
jgi:CRP/FNR family transcriptional regulator, nitrogen fixation regulation protein